jgi:hypothetical protein
MRVRNATLSSKPVENFRVNDMPGQWIEITQASGWETD